MRVSLFLLFICVFQLMATNTEAQNTVINIRQNSLSIKQLISEIEKQTDYLVVFRDQDVDVNKVISFQKRSGKVSDYLDEVYKHTNLIYVFENNYITISNKTDIVNQDMKKITGKVTDQNGEPVIGASVIEKGTTNGIITDVDGLFTLEVREAATIEISYIGYRAKDVSVTGKNNIQVQLIEDTQLLDEVVVVGYGTQKRRDITGSITRVDASKFVTQSTTNVLEMLNGTVAGFISNQGAMAEGSGSMLIRGQTSIKASNNPLIVLDGVIYNGTISNINPSDIETIDILKDASSSAVYGSRSANGVLIITTKRGGSGKPSLNFTSEFGISSARKTMRAFTPDEYIDNRGMDAYQTYGDKPLYYYSNPNNLPSGISLDEWKNLDPTVSDNPVDMWLNRLRFTNTEKKNYLAGKTVDWLDEVFRNGIRQDYNISITGGAPMFKYYFSGGYAKNQGVVVGDDFDMFRSRINLDVQVTSFLKINTDVQFSRQNNKSTRTSIASAISGSPYGEIYDDDGNMTWYTHEDLTSENPLLNTTYRDKYKPVDNLFATITGELSLPFDIKYKVSFVNNFSWTRDYQFDPLETAKGYNNGGYGYRSNTTVKEWMVDNLFTWEKTIADNHRLNLTFLYNIEKNQSWYDYQENSNFSPNDFLSYHGLQGGTNPSIKNNDEINTGNALMGRINYSLLDKYLLTLTMRRDGYSAFGQANPYAWFPSAALAWRISEEKFFNVKYIDYLKLRLSWGSNGNRSIGAYDALSKLGIVKYLSGTDLVTGVYSNTMANRELKWETTTSFNLGADMNMFNNRISLTLDAYLMNTKDLLIDRSLPVIIGYSNVSSNLGELENKGFELTLNTVNINQQDFSWNSSLVYSTNKNKIKHLYGDMVDILDDHGNVVGQKEADDITNSWFIGQSLDRIWDYKRVGIWQSDEAEDAKKYGKTPGDIKLKDQNNDGVLTPTDDKVFQGYKKPQHKLGLRNDIRYKNLELSFFIRADLGFYRSNPLYTSTTWIDRRNILNASYWTEENPGNEYPKLHSNNGSPSFNVWKNSSFVRLQDISLSYNFPSNLLTSLHIERLKVYMNMRNLVTITGWNHWDPESGTDPMPRFFTLGLNINF
ncbi:MAG: TonB-dependent receptor [Tannerella sp.]|nr:TonB-dependent receptor [Tannerella sp.]